MADIAQEIAALHQIGIRGRADTERIQRANVEAASVEAAQWCRYCFHERHEIQYASLSISNDLSTRTIEKLGPPVVLYCRADACACGISPCSVCGSRERRFDPTQPYEICAQCGDRQLMTAYA